MINPTHREALYRIGENLRQLLQDIEQKNPHYVLGFLDGTRDYLAGVIGFPDEELKTG